MSGTSLVMTNLVHMGEGLIADAGRWLNAHVAGWYVVMELDDGH